MATHNSYAVDTKTISLQQLLKVYCIQSAMLAVVKTIILSSNPLLPNPKETLVLETYYSYVHTVQ